LRYIIAYLNKAKKEPIECVRSGDQNKYNQTGISQWVLSTRPFARRGFPALALQGNETLEALAQLTKRALFLIKRY
jgi:hypothetical protein